MCYFPTTDGGGFEMLLFVAVTFQTEPMPLVVHETSYWRNDSLQATRSQVCLDRIICTLYISIPAEKKGGNLSCLLMCPSCRRFIHTSAKMTKQQKWPMFYKTTQKGENMSIELSTEPWIYSFFLFNLYLLFYWIGNQKVKVLLFKGTL